MSSFKNKQFANKSSRLYKTGLLLICHFLFFKKTTQIVDGFEGFSGHKDDDYNVINFSDDNNEN
jgi:hypothetical protein